MSASIQPPSTKSSSEPAAEPAGSQGFGRGPDAGLYFIGVIAVLAFISMIGVMFWVASRENATSVAVAPLTTNPPPETGQAGKVVLPLVIGESDDDAQPDLTQQVENPEASTPLPAAELTQTSEAANAQATLINSANPTLQSTAPGSAGLASLTPSGGGAARTATPSQTPNSTPTQTATATNQTPTLTPTGELGTLFIRNDQGCVDPRNGDLYIFGEIINTGTVSVDILNWDVTIYDNGRELDTGDVFLDIPNNYAVFANSSIPFALLTSLDRLTFTDYDISLDYAPGPHYPRSDLSIVEYTSTQSSGFTEIVGKWSHSDVANPPEIVWIIATIRDTLGRLTNLQYQHYLNASIPDPRLPPGQHNFRQLYLEDNPCGGGNISVSVLGE